MKLYFDPAKVKRTTTRQEWKEMHRWCRLATKELAKHEDELVRRVAEMQTDLMLFGHARIDIMDELINPPLLLGPGMEEALHG
jgi:hypothetical protein